MKSSHKTAWALGILTFFWTGVAAWAQAPIAWSWCTHATAQRLTGDVNGDGQADAVCHDRSTGVKWVALRESVGLVERWVNVTVGWCRHAGAVLHLADVNGDRRADLLCKDPARIWVDLGAADFYQGTDFFLDTVWCTHTTGAFFVGDQNGDGKADLVCRDVNGFHWVDFADSYGRFGSTDVARSSSDFFVSWVERSRTGIQVRIGNLGSPGVATSVRCRLFSGYEVSRAIRLPIASGYTETVRDLPFPIVSGSVECRVTGQGADGQPELFVSNNALTVDLR